MKKLISICIVLALMLTSVVLLSACSDSALPEAKDAAKTTIEQAYSGYLAADYSESNWSLLTKSKDDGLVAVEAATTIEAVAEASAKSIADMKAIETIFNNFTANSQADIVEALAIGSEKITLSGNLELTECLTIEHNMTLDLAGFTLSNASFVPLDARSVPQPLITISGGAKLTIKNGAIIATDRTAFLVTGEASELMIIDGTYTLNCGNTANTKPKDIVQLRVGAKATIEDGTFNATGYDNNGVHIQVTLCRLFNDSAIMVNNGTFVSNQYGFVAFSGGKVVFNNGVLTSEWEAFSGNNTVPEAHFEINGGTITVPNTESAIYMSSQGTLKVNGGTFTGGTVLEAKMGTITIGAAAVFNAIGTGKVLTTKPEFGSECDGSAILLNTKLYQDPIGDNGLTITIANGATLTSKNNNVISVYDWGKYEQEFVSEFGAYLENVVNYESNQDVIYKKYVGTETELNKSLKNARKGTTLYVVNDIELTAQITLENKQDVTLNLCANRIYGEIGTDSGRLFVTRGNVILRVKNGTLDAIGDATIIDGKVTGGSGAFGVFRAESGSKLYLSDLSLTNGRPNGLNIKVTTGSYAELTRVTINSKYGGGVEAAASIIELYDCTVRQEGYFDWCSTAISASSETVATSTTSPKIGTVHVFGGVFTSENFGMYVFNSGGEIRLDNGVAINAKTAIKADKVNNPGNPLAKIFVGVYDAVLTGSIDIDNAAEIQIACAEGIKLLSAILAGNKSFEGTISLTKDIDLTNVEWTKPTGLFKGTLDGKGHKIIGLANAEALITLAGEGKIENLTFIEA